jgi:hypothetical protein
VISELKNIKHPSIGSLKNFIHSTFQILKKITAITKQQLFCLQVVATNKAATILETKTRRHRCKTILQAKSTLHLGTAKKKVSTETQN